MTAISPYMMNHHKHCDSIFVRTEEAAARSDWAAVERDFAAFLHEMGRHFIMEEDLLFPAFEKKTGMVSGPTQVMRLEHDQMREMFGDMQAAVQQKNAEQYLGLSETLLVLLQQHNLKEESVLYSMMDRVLGAEVEALLAKLEGVTA